jgi:hypothetical protein
MRVQSRSRVWVSVSVGGDSSLNPAENTSALDAMRCENWIYAFLTSRSCQVSVGSFNCRAVFLATRSSAFSPRSPSDRTDSDAPTGRDLDLDGVTESVCPLFQSSDGQTVGRLAGRPWAPFRTSRLSPSAPPRRLQQVWRLTPASFQSIHRSLSRHNSKSCLAYPRPTITRSACRLP